jgi:hypothetical protein
LIKTLIYPGRFLKKVAPVFEKNTQVPIKFEKLAPYFENLSNSDPWTSAAHRDVDLCFEIACFQNRENVPRLPTQSIASIDPLRFYHPGNRENDFK